jgi:transcriptional regulator with XRE-family HTH domain
MHWRKSAPSSQLRLGGCSRSLRPLTRWRGWRRSGYVKEKFLPTLIRPRIDQEYRICCGCKAIPRFLNCERLRAQVCAVWRQLASMDFSWLSRLERGLYESPDARNLYRLARVLDVEVASLHKEAGYGEGLPGFACACATVGGERGSRHPGTNGGQTEIRTETLDGPIVRGQPRRRRFGSSPAAGPALFLTACGLG